MEKAFSENRFPFSLGKRENGRYGEKGKRHRMPGKGKRQSIKFELTAQVMAELLSVKGKVMTKPVPLDENDVKCCLLKVKSILVEEPSLLDVSAPTKIVGDIHGQFSDLVRLLECGGHPPEVGYIFLGDYVDRGNLS